MLSTSSEGGSIAQGVPQLPEAVVEVTDFEGDYEGKWERVEGIKRTGEDDVEVATARVHLVASDCSVRAIGEEAILTCRYIGYNAIWGSSNSVKVTAPFVVSLHHVHLNPDAVVKPKAFTCCLSLEVLAASAGFELDTGDTWGDYCNDPTVGITRFLVAKVCYQSTMVLLEFCNCHDSSGSLRTSTEDPLVAFIAGCGRDLAGLVLPFKFGEKGWKGGLREASKEKL